MATAAGDSIAYAGGAGGKFRRKPSRKPQTTPYDRPPTALRLTQRNDDSSTTSGWLSRIVDPASKLITFSAHKLFSSVFRNRLLPPPHPSKDEEVEPLGNHSGDAMMEAPSSTQDGGTTEGINTHNGSVAGLANILKQKTFTKSEIDRLTALLQSREVVKAATEAPDGQSRHNELRRAAIENGINPYDDPRADLTPAVRSNVTVADVASPTGVAKAYMGSMCTRVSPSTLVGLRSQAVKEAAPALTTLTSHRSNGSIMQKPSSPAVTFQKDFVVPRSRGRSAIYSMARTPYFKAQQTVTKGLGTTNDAFDGNSLLSSQKTLKRRSSVLENDAGSVGPIRRIRQKPNLLYPKTVDLPPCTPSTSATTTGVGEASSSRLHEEGGERSPFSNSHSSFKSMEMGHRILEQLERLTPPKDRYNEKKPGFSGGTPSMKLTPSMLSGQALKSLETIDLSKYVHGDEVREKKLDLWDTILETENSTTKEQDKFNNNSSKVLMISSSNVHPENGDARGTDYDVIDVAKDSAPTVTKSTIVVPKKSPAFHMSAYEDDLDMDDDAYITPSVIERKRNLDASYPQSNGKLPENPSLSDASKVGRPAFLGVESSSNSGLKNATTADASSTAAKRISHDKSDSVLNDTIGSSVQSLQPVKTSGADQADFSASNVSFDLKSYEKVSPPTSKQPSAAESSSAADVSSSSYAFGAASAHAPIMSPNNSIDAVGLFKQADTAPTSVLGSSISTIGSVTAPSPVMFSSPSPFSVTSTEVGPDVVNGATGTAPITSSENVSVAVTFPSLKSTFGGSSLTSNPATMAAPSTHTTENPKKADLVNSPSSNIFGTTSVPAQSPPASSVQFGPPVISGTKRQLEASSNGSVFGDQTSLSSTASAPKTEPVTSEPAGSLPSASAFSTTSFAFGSSSSGSSSTAAAFGSVSSAPTNIFGGISQQTSSPVFGSTLSNSSAGVSFGVSAAATPSSSASSALSFGTCSMSAPANGSSSTAVTFGSSTTSTAPAPAPGNASSSGFAFGTSFISAPANGSSNAGSSSLFGFGASSPAAPSSASSSSTFSFGASPAPPSSSSAPTSTFSFGASPASSPASSSAPSPSTFSFGASPAPPVSTSAPSSSTFSFGGSPSPPVSSSAPSSSTFSFGASPSPLASSSAPPSSSTFSFGASPASSSAPSSTFSFGASSSAPQSSAFSFGASSAPAASSTTTQSTFLFGASSASSTSNAAPVFPFGSAAATSTALQPPQPAFGTSSVFGFGSTPSPMGNGDQMSMEDSMVEDSMLHQSPNMATPPTPVFGQSPTSNFSFGMAQPQPQAPALAVNPFQFGNQVAASPNPFQASGSFDGGSFSLGAGGNDKSNRRIVKVKSRNRKK